MLLINTRTCITASSTLLFAVNIVVSVYMGMRAPDKNTNWWSIVPYRDILVEPPYVFKEVRLTLLGMSVIYLLGRLIYEAVRSDVFVVLVVVRLCAAVYQLRDQLWLCNNWKPFFVEHKLRAWLWLRIFIATAMQSFVACLYVMNDFEWIYFASHMLAGSVVGFWYMWGKHWDWRRNDLDDDRRLRAPAFAAVNTSLVFVGRMVHDLSVQNGAVGGSLVLAVGYFLIGLIFYVVDRRQRRLKAVADQCQTELESLQQPNVGTSFGSSRNHRVASGLDDDDNDDAADDYDYYDHYDDHDEDADADADDDYDDCDDTTTRRQRRQRRSRRLRRRRQRT